MRAVVFDLFGTLVREFRHEEWDRWFRATAEALGVDEGALRAAWRATSAERQTGRLGDIEGNLRAICERIGARPSEGALARALEARRRFYDEAWEPMPGAEQTLRAVRARGLSTGLVSMCAPDTPPRWRSSSLARWIDVEVFSSEVGLRKPDPAIYLLACDRLAVRPDDCLYVGDGSYGELSGAEAVGMRVVRLRDPAEREGEVYRPDEEPWDGPTIGSLLELIPLLR
ncbi:MAG TPA: HAD-IA family hydrolase [Actinomycetota bacterium]|nr:HAD-IA family hydrolase [Actinomycetota bacterium]